MADNGVDAGHRSPRKRGRAIEDDNNRGERDGRINIDGNGTTPQQLTK